MKRYEKMSTGQLRKLRDETDRKIKRMPNYQRSEIEKQRQKLSLIINELDYRASRIPLF